MPNLPSSKKVVKILEQAGFLFARQKGSHQRHVHSDGRKVTVISNKKQIPLGTIQSIARQLRIPIAHFLQ